MMKKITAIWILFALFSTLNIFGQAKGDEVLLTIEDETVTVDEFMRVYNKNNPVDSMVDRKDLEDYLQLYINFRLKVLEAEEMGLDTSGSFKKELAGYRKQLAQPYFKDESLEKSLLQQAYQRKQTDIRASHILVSVDKNAAPEDTLAAYKKAMDIRKRILAGEDFGELAATLSDDPSARDVPEAPNRPGRKGNRGDLGYFTVFDMVYPFENGAYNTETGDISMPVRTNYGYHLIYVKDKQPAIGQVQVAHVYVSHPKTADPGDSASARNKIHKAYELLEEGAEWDEIVKTYSEDKGSAGMGGKLPWFGANRMVPEFILAIRELEEPGDYTEPLKTTFGWHIIKLIERKPVGTFEEEKPGLQNRLYKDMRISLSEDKVMEKIKKEYKFKENTKALDELTEKIDSTLLRGKWNTAVAKRMDKTLFTLGDSSYTQYDFALYLGEKQHNRITSIDGFVNEQYSRFKEEKILEYEDSRLEEKYPEFRALVEEYHDGILLFDLTDQKVWSKAVKDTAGLKVYYAAHRDDYMWGKRADAVIYTILDPENIEVDEVSAMVAGGAPTQEVLEKYNTGGKINIKAEEGLFTEGENDILDKIKWKKNTSEIINSEEGTFIIKIKGILKPQPKSLDEARGLITADYQNHLEEKWVQELRQKYDWEVNEEVLSRTGH